MPKPLTAYYRVYDTLSLKVDDYGTGGKLHSLLSPYRSKHPGEPTIELILCRRKSQMPDRRGECHSAVYKGVPWKATLDRGKGKGVKRIYFYAASFPTFLVLRIVLIPYMKMVFIEKGGFNILGSVFRFRDRMFLLFGRPGSGKTHLTLKAMDKGAEFIADNELLFLQDHNIRGLFDELELRWGTARGTFLWSRLGLKRKCRLLLCQMISLLSFQFISFNLSVAPVDVGIESCSGQIGGRLVVIHLTGSKGTEKSTSDAFIDAVMDYEKWYYGVFGNLFSKDLIIQDGRLKSNMQTLLSDCSIWSVPETSDIETILDLS